MHDHTIASEAVRRAHDSLPEPFDGYPYLVTRIGHSALRHLAVLPADWSRGRLLDVARRQATANRLETCLCLGPDEAVYVSPDGEAIEASIVPSGIPVIERLALAESVPLTEEIATRHADLRALADRSRPQAGYIVGDGLEGGRPATPADIDRLSRHDPDGVPTGLSKCPTCGGFVGDYLARRGEGDGDRTPRVIRVYCRCENHNRCAGSVGYSPREIHRIRAIVDRHRLILIRSFDTICERARR